jgi:mucin-19
VQTTAAQSYAGAITLGANTALTTGASGTITLPQVNGGSYSLVATSGDITLGGEVTANGGITLAPTATKTIGLAGSDQAYDLSTTELGYLNSSGVVTIGAADAGTITLGGDVDSGSAYSTLHLKTNGEIAGGGNGIIVTNLALTAGDTINIGSSTISKLAVSNSGQAVTFTDIGGIDLGSVDGVTGITATTFNLTTSGAITNSVASTISGVTTLVAGAGNDITLDNASNAFGTVLVTSGKDVVLVDTDAITLGASTISGTLDVTAGGILTIGGAVGATGGATTLTANAMAIGAALDGTGQIVTLKPADSSTAINLGTGTGALDLTNTEIDYITATTLRIGADDASTGAITVSSDITPANTATLHLRTPSTITGTDGGIIETNLALTAGDLVNFTSGNTAVTKLAVSNSGQAVTFTDIGGIDLGSVDGVIGITATTFNLTTSGAITNSVASTISGTTTLNADENNITLDLANELGTVSVTSADDLTLVDASTLSLGAISGVTGDLVATATAGNIEINNAITTTGTQLYNSAVTLAAAANLTGSTVTFGSTIDGGYNLDITGNAVFGGLVGDTTPLTSLDVLSSGTTAFNAVGTVANPSVETTAAQSYAGAITLGANTFLEGTAITLGSTATGAYNFKITGASSLGGNVDTGGSKTQEYTGAVTLTAAANLTGSTVTFGSTIDGAYDLDITGNAVFGGLVGDTTPLTSLDVLSAGTTAFNAAGTVANPSVQTTAAQSYAGAITLGANTALTTGASGTITLPTVNGGSYSLVATSGDITLGGEVTANGGITLAPTTGRTIGLAESDKEYDLSTTELGYLNSSGVVTIGAADAGTITFGGDVDSGSAYSTLHLKTGGGITGTAGGIIVSNLALTAGGAIDFTNASTAVTKLAVSNSGKAVTFINSSGLDLGSVDGVTGVTATTFNLTTSGAITDSAVSTISGTTTLNADENNITLDLANELGTVSVTSADDLTLVDASTLSLGAISGVTGDLVATATAGNIEINDAITTTGTQLYNSAVTLAAAANLTGSTVTFSGALNSEASEANTLAVTGNAIFGSTVGTGTNGSLGSLSVSGTSSIESDITIVGTQLYTGAVTLTGSPTLTTTNSAITFSDALNSEASEANSLTTSLGSGALLFSGAVGTGTNGALGTIAITNSGGVTFSDALTAGVLNLSGVSAGAVALGGSATLTTLTTGSGAYNLALTGAI